MWCGTRCIPDIAKLEFAIVNVSPANANVAHAIVNARGGTANVAQQIAPHKLLMRLP